jgi:hypothetical protein
VGQFPAYKTRARARPSQCLTLETRARAALNPAPEQGATDDIAARFFT